MIRSIVSAIIVSMGLLITPCHAETDASPASSTPFRRYLATPKPTKSLVEQWKNQSRGEREAALHLKGNVANGQKVYLESCSNKCHLPHGQGSKNGEYPQIAGQLREVTIKQLADIRARNRDNPTMYRFALPNEIGGVQNIADVAAYIETLPMTLDNGKGPGNDLERGRRIHDHDCVICHGANGEGKAEQYYPLIQGQHYEYLVRQYQWIRDGRRRNAHPMMVEQIQGYTQQDIAAVMDHVSRLVPSQAKLKGSAPPAPPLSTLSPSSPSTAPKDDLL